MAALVIIAAGYHWFSATAGSQASAASTMRAEMSVILGDGRRLAFYLGPAATPSTMAPAIVEGNPIVSVATGKAGSPPAPAATPVAVQPVVADPAAGSKVCMLGSGVVSRASFDLGRAGKVEAFGVDDVATIRSGTADATAGFTLPMLQRVRAQGALAGMQVNAAVSSPQAARLPNILYTVDGDGVGDYALNIAHGAIDFLLVGDGDYVGELNPWYHSLNAGMRTQMIGTMLCNDIAHGDPVASRGDGLRMPASTIRRSFIRNVSYVSDGHSRLLDFTVNNHHPDPEYGAEMKLAKAGVVSVAVTMTAELARDPGGAAGTAGWNIEHARRGTSRYVTLDVVVNGKVVASRPVLADGSMTTVSLDVPVTSSSWIAVRLMGAGHSNPVFVLVDNRPVRGSRASVEWNLQALTRAHQAESGLWNAGQAALAEAAYDYAFAVYNHILQETQDP